MSTTAKALNDPFVQYFSAGGFPEEEVQAVRDCLENDIGVDGSLITPTAVDYFMRYRARNLLRGKYTVGGVKAENMDEVDPHDSCALLKNLHGNYMGNVAGITSDLDLFQLPTFKLMKMELYEVCFSCCDCLFESIGVDLDESTQSLSDGTMGKYLAVAQEAFQACSIERDGEQTLDVANFLMAIQHIKDRADGAINLDIETKGDDPTIVENAEAVVMFQSVTSTSNDKEVINNAQFSEFFRKQYKYSHWIHSDPPCEYTAFSQDDVMLVFNIYWFYTMTVISQMVLPSILIFDWSRGLLGEDSGQKYFAELNNGRLLHSLCTYESSYELKFAVCVVFSFLIILTDVGAALSNMERRILGKPTSVRWEEEDEVRSQSTLAMMTHSHMCSDPMFIQLGDFWNMVCYLLIIFSTYLMMQASGGLADVLKDIIAVNFLIELDNLVCEMIITERHRELMQSKMFMCYALYGEMTKEETEVAYVGAGLGGLVKRAFMFLVNYCLTPVIILLVYICYVSPLYCLFCI